MGKLVTVMPAASEAGTGRDPPRDPYSCQPGKSFRVGSNAQHGESSPQAVLQTGKLLRGELTFSHHKEGTVVV